MVVRLHSLENKVRFKFDQIWTPGNEAKSLHQLKLFLWPRKTIHNSRITGEKHLYKRHWYENGIIKVHRIEFYFETYRPLRIRALLRSPACLLKSCLSHFFSCRESLLECHSFLETVQSRRNTVLSGSQWWWPFNYCDTVIKATKQLPSQKSCTLLLQ